MDGLMMDFPLALTAILRRAETVNHSREVVSRLEDASWHRYTYGEMAHRARKLGSSIANLGLRSGDRVATLCWNHYRHLEAYFGVPCSGYVLHTLNPRLHADDLTHIVNEANDRMLIVDESLLEVLDSFRDRVSFEHIVVVSDSGSAPNGMASYEDFLASGTDTFDFPEFEENHAAAMCYTSGTTGRPKGVLYSHRALVLHTLVSSLSNAWDCRESDCVLPVVPMFHVNAWGLPYMAPMMGSKLVFPGRRVDPDSLLEGLQDEAVTITAGVPTVWIALLRRLDQSPGQWDLSRIRTVLVGGSALPRGLMLEFEERHGLRLVQAWGMTETTPCGSASYIRPQSRNATPGEQVNQRLRQGTPVPFVEARARNDHGLVPWDGKTMGELEVRGPWVAKAYYERPDAADRFTEDGWFLTGDVVSIDSYGSLKIEDRSKDLIKSGGEWISSIDLENALMAHEGVAEAAVIAVPDAKWAERPLAVVVRCDGSNVESDELKSFLADRVAKWWVPEAFEFVDEIPRTATGKFKKTTLRERFGEKTP